MPGALALLDAGLQGPATGIVTTRAGGVSLPPHDALNLAYHVGDDWDRAFANRDLLARAIGVPLPRLTFAQQRHGADVLTVAATRVGANALRRGARGVDALVTTATDAPLVILVADCVPLLLADVTHGVVAAAHAGRRGLVAGVVTRTIAAMVAAGAEPADIAAYVGPSICGSCYELPDDLADAVEAAVPGTRTVTPQGTAAVDVGAGVCAQLAACGVHAVRRDPACTVTDERFFSYRRDGVTGRFAAAVWLRAHEPLMSRS